MSGRAPYPNRKSSNSEECESKTVHVFCHINIIATAILSSTNRLQRSESVLPCLLLRDTIRRVTTRTAVVIHRMIHKTITQKDAWCIWWGRGVKSEARPWRGPRDGTHEFSPCTPPSTCALIVRNSKRTRPSFTPACSSCTLCTPTS